MYGLKSNIVQLKFVKDVLKKNFKMEKDYVLY